MDIRSTKAINISLKKGVPGGGVAAPLPPIARELGIFQGDAGNPLLAPRGVYIAAGMLFVSDTGQNRVFIWKKLPLGQPQAAPDVVLGQQEIQHTGRNGGTSVSGSTLMYPSGIWSDGKRLVVADAWNHRVLIWHSMPERHGQAADVVVGQPDFSGNQPNVYGIGALPSAQSLNWPYGVYVHEDRLFVADTGNRRVLVYNALPVKNGQSADHVLGKPSFEERDYEGEDAVWPYAVRISDEGQLAITDTQYYRVLLWNHWRDALHSKASVIVGQPDLASNGQNQFGLFPQAHTLSWCYDHFFYRRGLWVADTGNSRLLWYQQSPKSNGEAADNLIGKSNFTTGSENANTIFGTENDLYWPFSLCIDETAQLLVVADTGNHRIRFYELLH